ncbi:importin subunit alpha-1 [Galendromus occidentalis]|uniref:Importin subunit alpha n=1 Tax=Galendromus occidentalis TaxID=34638 RepID=A0AAJ6QQ00_9ACAR|nr:importin subunit alpha-1 [Galendromus occidentalis]
MTERLSAYKNRGKREEYMKRMKAEAVELRKAKKDEHLTKRRNLHDHDEVDDLELDDLAFEATDDVLDKLPDIVSALYSEDPERIFEATRISRKILSRKTSPPIDTFINANTIPRFVQLLYAESPALQFEAAWVLTNVASGNESQTRAALEAGISDAFVRLLDSSSPEVVEQVLWGLSNIAGTGAEYRDLLLQMGLLPVLVKLVESTNSRSLLATAAWCVSNLCRKMGSLPEYKALLPAIPVLTKLVQHDMVAVASDACWALSYFTDGSNERIEAVCRAGAVPPIIKLLRNCTDPSVLIPALRVIGNIVTGDDRQTQMVIDAGALSALKNRFEVGAEATKKEVIWALSNVLAGNVVQIEAVLNEGLMEPLIRMLSVGDYKTQLEATWAICNFTCGGTPVQISQLFEYDTIASLCHMLEFVDARLIKAILDAFGNILRAAQSLDSLPDVMNLLDEAGFVDRVEMLQMHELEEIYKRAANLLGLYWNDCSDDDEVIDDINPDGSRRFGIPESFSDIVM